MSEIKEKEKIYPVTEYESQRMQNLALATAAHKMANDMQTDQQYVEASEFLIKVKERRRWWEKLINPAIEAAHAAHKRMIAVKKEVDHPLERAENEILKPALLRYSAKKEAERKAAEDRLNLMMAQESQAEAPQTDTAPPIPTPVVVLPKTDDPKGISYVVYYSAEVTDLPALLKAVVDGSVPMEAIQPNMSFINNRAKTLKNLMSWPGVVVSEQRSVRATSKE